jgi:two-component system, NarL family, response regulator DevR
MVARSRSRHIRILVVDDHEMIREGVRAILEPEPDLELVAECGRADEAAALVERHRPDIVLLDARLPDVSGAEVCRSLTTTYPDLAVIILTTYTEEELVAACIDAGARGYVVKDVERFALKESIRAVARGESVISPQLMGKVMHRLRARSTEPAHIALNHSQIAILRLVAKGYSNREIATHVGLSENTIKTHLQAIFGKLHVRNRVEAAMLASRRHLI